MAETVKQLEVRLAEAQAQLDRLGREAEQNDLLVESIEEQGRHFEAIVDLMISTEAETIGDAMAKIRYVDRGFADPIGAYRVPEMLESCLADLGNLGQGKPKVRFQRVLFESYIDRTAVNLARGCGGDPGETQRRLMLTALSDEILAHGLLLRGAIYSTKSAIAVARLPETDTPTLA